MPITKLHLSSALALRPTVGTLATLGAFVDPIYLHQVVVRSTDGKLTRYRDLDEALAVRPAPDADEEWRAHFHVPLHAPPLAGLETTSDDLLGALDWLAEHPTTCQHLEMETYTWEVLPPELRADRVEEQIAREYHWTLARLRERGLA